MPFLLHNEQRQRMKALKQSLRKSSISARLQQFLGENCSFYRRFRPHMQQISLQCSVWFWKIGLHLPKLRSEIKGDVLCETVYNPITWSEYCHQIILFYAERNLISAQNNFTSYTHFISRCNIGPRNTHRKTIDRKSTTKLMDISTVCIICTMYIGSRLLMLATTGVTRILVWGGGINFRDLVSIAVISISHHDLSPVLCVRKKDLPG